MKRLRLAALAALAADLAATALVWARLPARAPVHWDLHGQVDRYGSRWELALAAPVAQLVLWAVAELLPRIDPRFAGPRDPDATETERWGATATAFALAFALVAGTQALVLLHALGLLHEPRRGHAILLAAFLLLVGNVIGRLRPSWFAGIRTPWTLSSDAVWRRTHRLAGRLMVAAGLLALVLAVALPAGAALAAAIALLLASVLLPAALSFFYWRAEKPA